MRDLERKTLVKEMMNDNQLDALLKEMGTETVKSSEAQLPSAGQIWFRAQIARKTQRRERIERPLLVMRGIAVIICLAVGLLFATEMRAALSSAYLLPLLVVISIAAIVALLLAIWPASKAKLQRR